MGMSPEEMGILFAGISSILATLIYFTKNLKESSCCGANCKQVVTDNNGHVLNRSTLPRVPKELVIPEYTDSIDIAMETFPPQRPTPAPRTTTRAHRHPLQAII